MILNIKNELWHVNVNVNNKDKIITLLTINTSSYSSSIMVLNDKNIITDTTEQILTIRSETTINNIFAIDNIKNCK